MKRKSLAKYFFHPIFDLVATIVIIFFALHYSKSVNSPLISYLWGIVIGFPAFYIQKLLFRKKIENYAQSTIMPLKDRFKLNNPYFPNKEVVTFYWPLWALIAIILLMQYFCKINSGMALLGSFLWIILFVPEYRKIFKRINELLQNT